MGFLEKFGERHLHPGFYYEFLEMVARANDDAGGRKPLLPYVKGLREHPTIADTRAALQKCRKNPLVRTI